MIGKKINQLATELAPVSTDLTIIGDPISGVSKKITLAQLGAIFSGAVSFYTNLAGFPATGDINVIYCAKDTQKLYLWSGSAYVEVFPSQALLDTYQLRSEKGNANGYASLDSQGKVPISQLPSSIMEYKGTWNASTNTPTLANGTGDTGDVYICNVAGTVNFGAGPITFAVGDYVIYSGTIWQRSSGAVGTVTSVAVSRSGDALAITGSPVTTSGTINIGFAGNSTQYINGAGNLVTFPGVINEAQNLITEVYNKTGATLTKGTVVYINGGQGNLPAVTKALATGDSTSAQTYGIVRNDITNNNNGYVVVAGRISDLDTQAYTEGTQLYLSPTTAGTFTSTKPYAPQHLVYVGIVVRAHPTQGVIEVKIQNGYELDELHNVAAQTPTNNDGLFWEASTSLWKNKSIATILGYTPQAQLNGTGFVKASGTSISYDNSTYVTIDTFETITASKNFALGLSLGSAGGTNQASVFQNTSSLFSGSSGISVFGFNSANNIYFGKGSDNGGVLQWSNSTVRYYTLPNATGTIALTSDLTGGTVTSVGLSSATSGVTIGSTPITTSGTITLAIATASGSQNGLLSSTDWTTFNNKQNTLTNPVTGTGTTNYLPKFTGTSTIGNSAITDNGTTVGIGLATTFSSTVTLTTSDARLLGGNTEGRLIVSNSDTSSYLSINGSSNGNNIALITNSFITFNSGASYAERMRLDASGFLGIGTTSPEQLLDVKNSGGGTAYVLIQGQGRKMYLGQDGTGATIYSDGAVPMWFSTNGTEKMRLNASGNLSIGNTNNTYKLDVTGTGRFTDTLTGTTAIFNGFAINQNPISAGTGATFTRYLNSGNDVYIGIENSASSFFGASAYASVFYMGSTNLEMFWSGAKRVTITNSGAATFSSSVTAGGKIFTSASVNDNIIEVINSDTTNGYGLYVRGGGTAAGRYVARFKNGADNDVMWIGPSNVGIGTTSPSARLHSYSSTTMNQLTVDGVGSIKTGINFANGGTTYGQIYFDNNAPYDLSLYQQYSTGSLIFGTNNTERMRITSGGNVGIGTSSPSAKLDVNGAFNSTTFVTNNSSTTINSSTNVNTAVLDCGIVVFRDRTNGGGCVVFYENNQTPIIISQSGATTFTVVTPLATQIQISNRSGARGLQALGGSSRNGVNLGWAVFRTEGGDA